MKPDKKPEPVVVVWIAINGLDSLQIRRIMSQARRATEPIFKKAGWKHVFFYASNLRIPGIQVIAADDAERVRLKEIEAEVMAALAQPEEGLIGEDDEI